MIFFVIAAIVTLLLTAALLLGYPLLVFSLKTLKKRPWKSHSTLPYLDVIIPSHGSTLLGQKISNTVVQYPPEKMQIIVVYSGTDQNVLNELRSFQDQGLVTLIEEAQRTGKTNAINIGLKRAVQEICVITDSDSMLENGALAKLVSPFADQSVGAVSGELVYVGDTSQHKFHSLLFNRYKKTIKNWESEIDSCSYAPGELLAFRRELVDCLPRDVVVDDYYILLTIRQKGYRCVSVSEAKVYEEPPSHSIGARERTRRVVSGTFAEASRFGNMMFNRKYGLFGLVIFPAYLLRLVLLPLFAVFFLLFLSIGLVEVTFVLPIVWIIVSLPVLAGLLIVGRNLLKYSFAMLLGMIYGLSDYLRGKRPVVWKECKEA